MNNDYGIPIQTWWSQCRETMHFSVAIKQEGLSVPLFVVVVMLCDVVYVSLLVVDMLRRYSSLVCLSIHLSVWLSHHIHPQRVCRFLFSPNQCHKTPASTASFHVPFLIAYFCFRWSIYCKPEAQCLANILRLTFLYFVLSISLAANLLDVNLENLVVILLCTKGERAEKYGCNNIWRTCVGHRLLPSHSLVDSQFTYLMTRLLGIKQIIIFVLSAELVFLVLLIMCSKSVYIFGFCCRPLHQGSTERLFQSHLRQKTTACDYEKIFRSTSATFVFALRSFKGF